MMDLQTGEFLGKNIGHFIISSERVAHVQLVIILNMLYWY